MISIKILNVLPCRYYSMRRLKVPNSSGFYLWSYQGQTNVAKLISRCKSWLVETRIKKAKLFELRLETSFVVYCKIIKIINIAKLSKNMYFK